MSVSEKATLYDIPAYSMKQVDELATTLMAKLELHGDELPVDEYVQLKLLRTLLDGFA